MFSLSLCAFGFGFGILSGFFLGKRTGREEGLWLATSMIWDKVTETAREMKNEQ